MTDLPAGFKAFAEALHAGGGDDFQNFVEAVKAGIREEFDSFGPEQEDYDAQMILLDSSRNVLVVPGLGRFLGCEEDKDLLGGKVMPALIRRHEATHASWISSAWLAVMADKQAQEEGAAWRREHGTWEGSPWTVEVVQAWIADFTGTFTQLSAPLLRPDGAAPPAGPISLGEWMDDRHGGRLDGSRRLQWFDPEVQEGLDEEWPRLQGDALLALAGSPTSSELREAVYGVTHDPEFLQAALEAAERAGVDLMEADADGLAAIAAEMGPDFTDWFRDEMRKRVGPPSPITARRAS